MERAESNEIGRESCAEAKVISFCHTCSMRPMYIVLVTRENWLWLNTRIESCVWQQQWPSTGVWLQLELCPIIWYSWWWFKEPVDIDFDCQANIYVLDCEKHWVLVFSEHGRYWHEFGQNELGLPQGLCVRDNYVYITDCKEGCCHVSVFCTSGEFVNSFGYMVEVNSASLMA